MKGGKLCHSLMVSYQKMAEATIPGDNARIVVGVRNFQKKPRNEMHMRVVVMA